MKKKEIASKVLDYWYAMEFLGQDSNSACLSGAKYGAELARYKANPSAKTDRKQLTVFESVAGNADIHGLLEKQAIECGMSTWGNLTFYVGKIKRQLCIEKLASRLGVNLEQAEPSTDSIPVLSFQCTANGVYIEHSLSLSTVVWATSQVAHSKDAPLSVLLSEKAYTEALNDLEETLFGSGAPEEQANLNDTAPNAAAENDTTHEEVPFSAPPN